MRKGLFVMVGTPVLAVHGEGLRLRSKRGSPDGSGYFSHPFVGVNSALLYWMACMFLVFPQFLISSKLCAAPEKRRETNPKPIRFRNRTESNDSINTFECGSFADGVGRGGDGSRDEKTVRVAVQSDAHFGVAPQHWTRNRNLKCSLFCGRLCLISFNTLCDI